MRMRHALGLAALAVVAACSDDPPPDPVEASRAEETGGLRVAPRSARVGDRYSIRIEATKRGPGNARNTRLMTYTDEVVAEDGGRPTRLKRSWDGGEATGIAVVDGVYEPRLDEFVQYEALLPGKAVKVGEEWTVETLLAPFGHGDNDPIERYPAKAKVSLARWHDGVAAEFAALIDVDGSTLKGILVFEIPEGLLTTVALSGQGYRLNATRELAAAK